MYVTIYLMGLRKQEKLGLQNLGLTRGVMSFKLMIPFFKKIDIKKIIFLLKFNS